MEPNSGAVSFDSFGVAPASPRELGHMRYAVERQERPSFAAGRSSAVILDKAP